MNKLRFINKTAEAVHQERAALSLVEEGHLEEAMKAYERLFGSGYTEMCLSLGKLCDRPGANSALKERAYYWFKYGAEQLDDPECHLALAIMALRENGALGDKAAGVRHLVVASEIDPLAKAMLGKL